MQQKETTFKHANEYCPKCKTHKYTLWDNHHGEVYCKKCGLVIRDTHTNPISQQIQLIQYNEKRLYKLHRKKRHKPHSQ